jgi:hypothetical protein
MIIRWRGTIAALLLSMSSAFASEPRDIKAFVSEAFAAKIDAITKGIYCRALSCDFQIETLYATETDPQTYAISATGYLEGTIIGLHGSAKRSVGLTASYTRGTCIVKNVQSIYDQTTKNDSWGASRVESLFKDIEIPKIVVLSPEDCRKVDSFIFQS